MSPSASIMNKLMPAETKVGDLLKVASWADEVSTSAFAISAKGPLT
jgi:hypothetical protein